MRSNKPRRTYSPRTYGICAKIMYVVGAISALIGLISIKAGGIVFIILGACCILIARGWQKRSSVSVGSAEQHVNLKKEDYNVVGVSYYPDGIRAISHVAPAWRKKPVPDPSGPVTIYKYEFDTKPVELVPEPENPHDRNAVGVVINGHKVGHISAEEAPHVKEILERRDIKYISAVVNGGDRKTVYPNGDVLTENRTCNVSVRIAYV